MSRYTFPDAATAVALATPAARTATLTGTGVDLVDYEGKVAIVQNIGVVSGTNPTWDGKIQDSPDNSNWTDVSGATFTQVTASTNIQKITINANSVARYVRYVGTIGGTSTPTFNSSVMLIGQKQSV